ncbi:MAG: HNH endonuclease [Mogibacterium sp.]|nr:HNH endonuclease [Mogibacterium sp.]
MSRFDWFYKSSRWLRCRDNYLETRDHLLCDRCLKEGRITPGLIVHHKIHLSLANIRDPKIAYNNDNFEFLCLDCHNAEHAELKESRVEFSADGSVSPRSSKNFSVHP